ncbi:MAG: glycosyl hydrolase-related protein, partial [Bacteroidia bacterium]|nr:glycosyl hydrolase-related protein [Bacteroidia bacterium]
YNDYVNLKKGFFETVQHFSNQTDFWYNYYSKSTGNPVMPVLSDADMAVPDSYFDYIDTWNSLKDTTLKLPELVGGKNGDITDQTFLDKFREADQVAISVIEESTMDIAGNIGFTQKGIPLVIFNSLTWERTDPVEVPLNFPDKAYKGITLQDGQGKDMVFQTIGQPEFYPSGYLKSTTVAFIAENVPSLGYQTYYIVPGKSGSKLVPVAVSAELVETENYRIKFGKGGIESLFDKDLQKEIWKTDQFKAGDLFSMRSVGNGAGEFADVQQPDMEGFEKAGIGPVWNVRETGPVRIVIDGSADMKHNKAKVAWIIYPSLKRIDVKVDLVDWDGTAYREFRLAFPARLQNPEISYEVPFGVVRVGKDELAQAAGERYTTPCKNVHPRGINNWISASDSDIGLTISSGVAVWDYVNMTNLQTEATLLQPILLASRQSCHGEGPLYHQKGSHSMEFSLFTHQPGWKNGYRQALQANEKLTAVFNPLSKTSILPDRITFLSVDDPNSIVSTVKKSEDDNGLIIRLYDQEGRDKPVKINLFRSPVAVEHTDMIEENGKPIPKDEKGLKVKLGHHAIETYKIRF